MTYDPNGNIKTYLRNGDTRSQNMDNLSYHYLAGTNRLSQVTDKVTAPTPAGYSDLKTQGVNNYRYDNTGNLISDSSEGIKAIDWTVYGKIESIRKTDGTVIRYTYDAGGNRISKIVTTTTSGDSTYYVRDASGNVMSVYYKNGLDLTQTELHLYGSSRLGVYNVNTNVENCTNTVSPITIFTRGNKFFELANHLGNVLVTVSDKKVQVSLDGINNAYYKAEVVTAVDYYPFGMLMPGRKYSVANTKYRYGFNGKEMDDDVKGEGNQQDYGMRIYDPRLGRFLSVDPLTDEYPFYSSYQFGGNNPIRAVDLDGAEGLISMFLPNPFTEKNTAKLKNNLGISKGSLADKAVDFISGAGNEARNLNDPISYIKSAGSHLRNLYNNGKSIITATNSKERLNAAIHFGLPSLNAVEQTGQQTMKAAKSGDYRTMGALFTNLAAVAITARISAMKPTYEGFSKAESGIINETKVVLKSDKLQLLIDAFKEGRQASVNINGRNITYEPDIPTGQGYRAITNSDIKGFHLAGDAFINVTELAKTILHELHRLEFSEVVKKGEISGASAAATTKSADTFANSATQVVIHK